MVFNRETSVAHEQRPQPAGTTGRKTKRSRLYQLPFNDLDF